MDESVNFLDRRVYIVASSNGFLLFNSQRVNKQRIYYVYSPVMKWCLALPKTKICIKNPAVGFICKVRDLEKDVISFTIVRYSLPNLWGLHFTSITIESFSSETNLWTTNFLKLDVPLGLCPSLHRETSSAGVIVGVFCWLDQQPQITVYDSVHKCIWALELPQEIVAGNRCFLGISGGELYLVLNDRFGEAITVWYLQSNIRIRDAVWVRKYVANIATTLVQCPQANFGLASSHLIVVQNVIIHPAVPHIFYLVVRGKVFSYDLETDVAEFVYDFGEPCSKTRHYTLFSYEWDQWPYLL